MEELLKSIEGLEAHKAVAIMLEMIKAKGNPDEEIMDIEALANYLKVKKSWVYKRVQFKEIPFSHVGKYPRFRNKEIDTWFNEKSGSKLKA